ncbi:hypothetical protein D9758_015241 [Tetrapyrgos nigripes]|uniref:Uncharacterized protein n=1 Tax=Tetrapyrgos nigripes TaxID=182062 RepID=A0A8H5C2X8_9AGAR|nr:hypothetical protein D9758_015241 [Tetrapyrgos nigripes]
MRKRKAPSFAQAQTQTHKKSVSSEKDKEYGTLRTLAGRSRKDNLKANLSLYCKGRGSASGKIESPLPLVLGSSGGVAEEFEKVNPSIGYEHGHGQGQFRGLSLISVHTPVHRVNFGDENARAISLPTITMARTPSDVRRNRRQNSNDNANANSVSDDEGLDSDIDSFTIVWDDIPDCLRFQMRNTRSFSLTQDRRALEEVLSLTNTLPDRVPEKPSTLLLSNDDFEQVSVDSLGVIPASSPPNPGESLRKQITRRAFYDEMKLSEDRGVTTGHGRRIRWQEKQTLTGNAANAATVATTTANKASSKRKRIFLQYQVPLYQDGVDTARVTQIHPLRIGSFRLIAVYYTLAKWKYAAVTEAANIAALFLPSLYRFLNSIVALYSTSILFSCTPSEQAFAVVPSEAFLLQLKYPAQILRVHVYKAAQQPYMCTVQTAEDMAAYQALSSQNSWTRLVPAMKAFRSRKEQEVEVDIDDD